MDTKTKDAVDGAIRRAGKLNVFFALFGLPKPNIPFVVFLTILIVIAWRILS
jgi:hypothetical protein